MTNQELKNIIVEELKENEGYLYALALNMYGAHCSEDFDKCNKFAEETNQKYADNIIDKLPEQIITEDRIVEVLDSHLKYFNAAHLSNQIASEILKGQDWEVVARGGVTRFDLIKYKDKNIEIAVREVK